jgi:signal peptidase II
MDVGQSVTFIPGVMNITYIENDGAAFGMLDNARWVFIIISSVAIVGIILFLHKYGKRHTLLTVSLSCIAGGGIGNMIDRIFVTDANGVHVVTDFFETKFVKFAVFNVADSFITIGSILLGVYILFYEPKIEKKLKAAKAVETTESEEEESPQEDNQTNEDDSSDNR